MTQILNSYRQQWARKRTGKGNPHFRCGPVTVIKPAGRGKPEQVNILHRFDRKGRPIEKP